MLALAAAVAALLLSSPPSLPIQALKVTKNRPPPTTKMDFFSGIVALLALVVLVLTALVAWLYVQQTRITQSVAALTAAITAPPAVFYEAVKEYPIPEETETEIEVEQLPEEATKEATKEAETDDRVSVHDEEEEAEEADEEEDADDHDDLGSKTIAQLRELLNSKGIPFNKSDKKTVLVNLLKAAS